MESNISIDISKNKKQAQYLDVALRSVIGNTPHKYLCYGGAIRGGKTFCTLAILLILSKKYPNSKSHIIRETFPLLQSTTIPSFQKLITNSNKWGWNRDKSNYFAYNRETDSKIYFKAENYYNDPELNAFLGLETNFIFMEQSEELSERLWEKSLERVGSWYLPNMPRGLIFQTFNPTQKWPKKLIYEPYIEGTLKDEFFFLPALPSENQFVTQDQWDSWAQMSDRYQKQFVSGDWTNFDQLDNRWAYAFNRDKHLGKTFLNKSETVYLSWDFNRSPLSVFVCQHYNYTVYGIELISIDDATIYTMCEYIKQHYKDCFFSVCGDISGAQHTVSSRLTSYETIRQALNLHQNQLQYTNNPPIAESRILVNAMLERYNIVFDDVKCDMLIKDFETCKADDEGKIIKKNRNDMTQRADALDAWRYYINKYFKNFLPILCR